MSCIKFLVIILLCALLSSCASIVLPDGGEKDTKPPQVVYSTPLNKSNNYEGIKIVIAFDEYIKLNNTAQIQINPQLKSKPTISSYGKKIYIEFKDSLEANTTYSIDFAESISDNNENNILQNYLFTFSTGADLDTAIISGATIDALTQKALENVSIYLYKDRFSFDTTHTYLYKTKTNLKGEFLISALNKNSSFFLYAINDLNNNNLCDPEELFSFSHGKIGPHDSAINIKVPLYRDFNFTKFHVDSFNSFNNLHFKTVIKPFAADIKTESKELYIYEEESINDTLNIYALDKPYNKDHISLILISDTLLIPIRKLDSIAFKTPKVIIPNGQEYINVIDSYIVKCTNPILDYNKELFELMEDSTPVLFKLEKSSNPFILKIWAQLKESKRYRLRILPNAITTYYHTSNPDTINSFFKTRSTEDYGTLKLKLSNTKPSQIIELINEKGLSINNFNTNDTSKAYYLTNLLPGLYKIRVITDKNSNKHYDSGYYKRKTEPEPVYVYPLDILIKAAFDTEDINIDLKNMPNNDD
jgi:uncharacterized protein YceK